MAFFSGRLVLTTTSALPAFNKGYCRVFYQGITDHRGAPEYPGRRVTLEPAEGEVCYLEAGRSSMTRRHILISSPQIVQAQGPPGPNQYNDRFSLKVLLDNQNALAPFNAVVVVRY